MKMSQEEMHAGLGALSLVRAGTGQGTWTSFENALSNVFQGGGSSVSAAAQAMNDALAAHGYKESDMPLYKAFQAAAGLTADGYPGTNTMNALKSALSDAGITMASVKIYPWHAGPGYDGVNAPTLEEWSPGSSTSMQPSSAASADASPSFWAQYGNYVIGGAALAGAAAIGYVLYKEHKKGHRSHAYA